MRLFRYPSEIIYEDMTGLDTPIKDVIALYSVLVGACNKHRAIALAANQLGLRMNFLILGVINNKNKGACPLFYILINPKILEIKGKSRLGVERSRSLPNFRRFNVRRKPWVKVEYTDINGKTQRRTFRQPNSRTFLHAYDQLRGRMIDETGEEINPQHKGKMETKSMDIETARKWAQVALDIHSRLELKPGDDILKAVEELKLVEASQDPEDALDAARLDKLEEYLTEENYRTSVRGGLLEPGSTEERLRAFRDGEFSAEAVADAASLRELIDILVDPPAKEEETPEPETDTPDGGGTGLDESIGDEISDSSQTEDAPPDDEPED